MTENVLNTINISNDEEADRGETAPKFIKDSSNLIFQNEYAAGELFAGMNAQDGSFHDFMVKLISVFTSMAKKEGKSKIDQRIIDIMKSSLLMFSDAVAPKRDDRHTNIALLSTVSGFVNKYIENIEETANNHGNQS